MMQDITEIESCNLKDLFKVKTSEKAIDLTSFILIDKLGKGGFSVVYRVLDVKTMKDYALKIYFNNTENYADLANQEIKVVKAIASDSKGFDCIPVIITWGTVNLTIRFKELFYLSKKENNPMNPGSDEIEVRETYFLLMEYGHLTLRNLLVKDIMHSNHIGRYWAMDSVLKFMATLVSIMLKFKEWGIEIADLKPDNIIFVLTANPSQSPPKLKFIDFNVSQIPTGSTTTTTRNLGGTDGYMAPEKKRGKDYDIHKADLYSLGVVLDQVLKGVARPSPATNYKSNPIMVKRSSKSGEMVQKLIKNELPYVVYMKLERYVKKLTNPNPAIRKELGPFKEKLIKMLNAIGRDYLEYGVDEFNYMTEVIDNHRYHYIKPTSSAGCYENMEVSQMQQLKFTAKLKFYSLLKPEVDRLVIGNHKWAIDDQEFIKIYAKGSNILASTLKQLLMKTADDIFDKTVIILFTERISENITGEMVRNWEKLLDKYPETFLKYIPYFMEYVLFVTLFFERFKEAYVERIICTITENSRNSLDENQKAVCNLQLNLLLFCKQVSLYSSNVSVDLKRPMPQEFVAAKDFQRPNNSLQFYEPLSVYDSNTSEVSKLQIPQEFVDVKDFPKSEMKSDNVFHLIKLIGKLPHEMKNPTEAMIPALTDLLECSPFNLVTITLCRHYLREFEKKSDVKSIARIIGSMFKSYLKSAEILEEPQFLQKRKLYLDHMAISERNSAMVNYRLCHVLFAESKLESLCLKCNMFEDPVFSDLIKHVDIIFVFAAVFDNVVGVEANHDLNTVNTPKIKNRIFHFRNYIREKQLYLNKKKASPIKIYDDNYIQKKKELMLTLNSKKKKQEFKTKLRLVLADLADQGAQDLKSYQVLNLTKAAFKAYYKAKPYKPENLLTLYEKLSSRSEKFYGLIADAIWTVILRFLLFPIKRCPSFVKMAQVLKGSFSSELGKTYTDFDKDINSAYDSVVEAIQKDFIYIMFFTEHKKKIGVVDFNSYFRKDLNKALVAQLEVDAGWKKNIIKEPYDVDLELIKSEFENLVPSNLSIL